MTINDIKEIVDFIVDKHQSEYVSGDEFNRMFRFSEIEHIESLLGFKRDSRMGPAGSPLVVPGGSRRVDESLSPFRQVVPYSITSGQVSKPAKVAFIEAANTKDGKDIDILSPGKLGSRLKSVVLTPQETPFCCVYDDYTVFYPFNIGDVMLTVINYPPFSRWGFTSVGGSTENYDSATSIDPLWRPGDCYDIVASMLKGIGIKINEQEVFGYAQSIINKGE